MANSLSEHVQYNKTFTTHSCPPFRFFCRLKLTVSHRIIQRNYCVFSICVLSYFSLPLRPTCLVLTVSEARSYFASAIRPPCKMATVYRRFHCHLYVTGGTWSCFWCERYLLPEEAPSFHLQGVLSPPSHDTAACSDIHAYAYSHIQLQVASDSRAVALLPTLRSSTVVSKCQSSDCSTSLHGYKQSRYKSEARVHMSCYFHCTHPLYRCFLFEKRGSCIKTFS
jgi:hypothetical protein